MTESCPYTIWILFMSYDPRIHNRKSIRLKDYDYTQPGSYFVNICTANRRCIFGTVKNSEIFLSDIGKIAFNDWLAIPNHYHNVSLDTFQIMPNHTHGIIVINEPPQPLSRDTTQSCPDVRTQNANSEEVRVANEQGHDGVMSLRNLKVRKFGQPIRGSLSAIIGAYKAGVTSKVRAARLHNETPLWQGRFYDHIIRDDVDLFMIQQYIRLNLLFWEFDIDNPNGNSISFDEFEKMLVEKYDITGNALYMVLDSKKMNRVRII